MFHGTFVFHPSWLHPPGFDANIFISKSLIYVESTASEQTGTMCRLIGDARGRFTHDVMVKFSRPRSSSGCRIVFGFFYKKWKKKFQQFRKDELVRFSRVIKRITKCTKKCHRKMSNLSQFGHSISGYKIAFGQSRYKAHHLILALTTFFFAQHERFQYL